MYGLLLFVELVVGGCCWRLFLSLCVVYWLLTLFGVDLCCCLFVVVCLLLLPCVVVCFAVGCDSLWWVVACSCSYSLVVVCCLLWLFVARRIL